MAIHQKGDVYTLTGGNKLYPPDEPFGPDDITGAILLSAARHVTFEAWEAAQHVAYFLDPTPTPLGYHFILADTIQIGSMSIRRWSVSLPAHLNKNWSRTISGKGSVCVPPYRTVRASPPLVQHAWARQRYHAGVRCVAARTHPFMRTLPDVARYVI